MILRVLVLALVFVFILPSMLWAAEMKFGDWEALQVDKAVTYKGKPSQVWNHAEYSSVMKSDIPHDWTAYNHIEFALHSEKVVGTSFMLILASENEKSEGPDYFSLPIKMDWTGWKEFILPFAELGGAREPLGWRQIDSIRLTAEGWDNAPHPEAVIRLADFKLTRRERTGMSDEEFFQALDLTYPGLEKVGQAVKAGDLAAAKRELAQYLRNREKPLWKKDWRSRPRHDSRPEGVNTQDADKVLERELPSVGVWHKFEGEIDWTLNPINYREWPWQLNRHRHWQTLGQAYWATGDEKYAREFVYQLLHWVENCPRPQTTSGNGSMTWRTIEAGIRSGQTWPDIYHLFLTSPSFTDEAVVTMVRSLVEHAQHLMRWPTKGNWLAMEANGLMHVGVLFPEFKEAETWRQTAAERLYAEMDKQVYPDGAQVELTTGYHQVSLNNFILAWEIAHLNDFAMPADYVAKMERMFDYNLHASMPDGTLPGLNDGGRTNIKGQLGRALAFFPNREDFRWVSTQGKEGKTPTVGSIPLAWSGQLVMRSGWEPDDLYLLMDAGPFGLAHQHEDALSIVIYSHGKYHLVDAGNYAYDSSEWRKYVLSTRGHNTIMVDGMDQNRRAGSAEGRVVSKPRANKWASGDGFDYASAVFDSGYGPDKLDVIHSRRIFFVKPEYWIVTDFMTPSDGEEHLYESLFHLDAEGVRVDEKSKSVRTTNPDGNLAIIPLADESLEVTIVEGQEDPVVQGWFPAGGYRVRPIPTPIFKRNQSGAAVFAYVFYPTAKGVDLPVIEIRPLDCGGSAVGMEIEFADGRKDYFIQANQPGIARFLDFETDAEAAWVRIEGNRVVKASLAGGTTITRGGKAVEAETHPIRDLSETDERFEF